MAKLFTNSNKKGNLYDFMTVGELILVIAILGFLVYVILTNFSSGLDQVDTGGNYTAFIEGARNTVTTSLDWASLSFLVAALIFSVIMAKKIPTEPKFIGIMLLISFIFFIFAFVISNAFGAMMDNVTFANIINVRLPITKILLQYFPFVVAIYEAIVLIVFFSKEEQP